MRVELNIPGVLALPSDAEGWTDRAVTLAHLELGVYAEKLENFSGVLTRMIFQEQRARFVARIANTYLERGWTVYLRGHSNGCDIIRRALFHIPRPSRRDESTRRASIAAVQLVAPAVEPDFERNGFNQLLDEARVGRVLVCWSRSDRTLRWARLAHPLLNLLGNSFGTMGLTGPRGFQARHADRVLAVENPAFDHNDWLRRENLRETIAMLHQ